MSKDKRHILVWLGLVLVMPLVGPYVLNAIFFPAPDRPAHVPEDARPLREWVGDKERWWWASCREQPGPRYRCRLFDQHGETATGLFAAVPRTYSDDDGERDGKCPAPGKTLRFVTFDRSSGEILLPLGCWLVPQQWLYFPVRKVKASVVPASGAGSLAPEEPMSEEDIRSAQ